MKLKWKTYSITSQDEEFVIVRQLCLGRVGRTDDKLFHGGVAETARNSKNAVHAATHNESPGVHNSLRLLLVSPLVIIRETQSSPAPAQDATGIASIRNV